MNAISMNTCHSMSNSNIQGSQPFGTLSLGFLTVEEERQISEQFQGHIWHHNSQVLWSGIPPTSVELWADKYNMQTLTTAMGPLKMPEDQRYLRKDMSQKSWSRYMKGASAVFAWHILRGERVTVLTPPPPERFNPCGLVNYQLIEEPILKRERDGRAALRIDMVHPDVKGAEDFSYQIWPVDETHVWIEKFGLQHKKLREWRTAKLTQEAIGSLQSALERDVEDGEFTSHPTQRPTNIIVPVGKEKKVSETIVDARLCFQRKIQ